ncbi:hypothetical protein, partial [Klebsiella pneumoniae]|uniref:hypothetical protein n=1 Tax=Klebsiella pneumoniae TaxID=573 RepID=UPI0019672DB6
AGALKPCNRAGVIAHTGTFIWLTAKKPVNTSESRGAPSGNQHNKLPSHFSLPFLQPFPLRELHFSTFNA